MQTQTHTHSERSLTRALLQSIMHLLSTMRKLNECVHAKMSDSVMDTFTTFMPQATGFEHYPTSDLFDRDVKHFCIYTVHV